MYFSKSLLIIVFVSVQNITLQAQINDNNLVWRHFNGCDWSGRIDLGGDLVGGVTSITNGPHVIDLFGIGMHDNDLVWRFYDGNEWSGWINLGGDLKGGLQVIANGPNQLDLFGIGIHDNDLVWTQFDGRDWSGWINLGGDLTGGVTVTASGPSRLDVFGVGIHDNDLVWRKYDGRNWSGWLNLGGDLVGSVSVTADGPNDLDVFGIGVHDNDLVWRQYDGIRWSGWINLGGDLIGGVNVTANGPNTLDVFGIGKHDNDLVWRKLNGRDWSGWINLGGDMTGAVTVVKGPQESILDVFGIGKADEPWIEEIDQLVAPYDNIRQVTGERNVLFVLWDPHFPNLQKPDMEEFISDINGSFPSVRTWFTENSQGKLRIKVVDVLGWYDANMPEEWYDGQGLRDKAVAALMASDNDFDYSDFDDNGNGRIEFDELTVVFGHPGTGGGLLRVGDRSLRDDNGNPFKIDGVIVNEVAELSIGNLNRRQGLIAHELCHAIFGAGDMYISRTHTRADWYSIMDQDGPFANLDPFHKLKAGWLNPKLVNRNGRYDLEAVESTGDALILYDPYGPPNEYFIIENRWRSCSHDVNLLDEGLAIWHIIEDRDTYLNAYVPANVDVMVWNDTGLQGWGRKAVRMVRPVIEPSTPGGFNFPQQQALWDGAEPATGYDLKSIDSNPSHNTLRWSNGCPTGFSIKSISPASEKMSFEIVLPAHMGSE